MANGNEKTVVNGGKELKKWMIDKGYKDGPLPYGYLQSKVAEHPNIDADAEKFYQKFRNHEIYSWKTLSELSGKDILDKIFLVSNKNKDNESLCHALVHNKKYNIFGGTGGVIPSNYGVYYSKKEGEWKTALERENGDPKSISLEEAIEAGGKIRKALVDGAQIIEKWEKSLNTIEDYRKMFKELEGALRDYIRKIWVLKYYHMSFPDVFPIYYSKEWQNHILCSLHIMPDEEVLVKMAQIALYTKKCGISNVMLGEIAKTEFGGPKTFYRIGTGEGKKSFFDEWEKEKYVAIGWKNLGDLNVFYQNETSGGKQKKPSDTEIRRKIQDKLAEEKYDTNAYRTINRFYTAPVGSYVVVMKGSVLYGIGEITGGYEYKGKKEYAHCRPVEWKEVFKEEERPYMTGGRSNFTFGEIKNTENIFTLYLKLHGIKGTNDSWPRNWIFFGAPGTGKSYLLNKESNELLKKKGGERIRVTFHPDYSYAHFVGTYKPVPDDENNKEITYKYVPGPFMETYVKAVENPDKNYLLLIEEINRANVAAVFGDVFQLLDRKDGVSEYPVKASKDIRDYLRYDTDENKKRQWEPEECREIKIPGNMYIWATMNSADQGVFPMDTAFKRRWDFKYLGINTGEEKIAGMVPMGASGQMEWNAVRTEINRLLGELGINEDKHLGAFFVGKDIIDNAAADPDTFQNTFKNKVLMYLFEDAAKHKRKELFGDGRISYSEICRRFDEEKLEKVFPRYGAGKKGGGEDGEEEGYEYDETDSSAEVEGE